MTSFVLALLVPALAVAAPPASSQRLGVLLVPLDKGAESKVPELESYVVDALRAAPPPGTKILTPLELLGAPSADASSAQALKRADEGLLAGRTAFDAKNYTEAERRLRAAVLDYGRAAAAIEKCTTLCEALALYGATLKLRGNDEEAVQVYLDLLALSPEHALDPKRFPKPALAHFQQAKKRMSAQTRLTPQIQSVPSGARVFLDGAPVGVTPMILEPISSGRHLLRVERPGFQRYGDLVPVSPETATVRVQLRPMPPQKTWEAALDKVLAELKQGRGGPAMAGLGKSLGLDRGLVGMVKVTAEGTTSVDLALFEFRTGKRLGGRRARFQGEEFGQLRSEVARLVAAVLSSSEGGGAPSKTKSGDPLEQRQGTEEWSNESRPKANEPSPSKSSKSKDPLDSVSGTEDW